MIKTGKAHRFGNNVDTDQIIPSQYLVLPTIKEMIKHVMEPVKSDFYKSFSLGDIIVGGRNFGCGSSREQAVVVFKEMGVGCIIAESFSRIYYRNCINLGISVIELESTRGFEDEDTVSIDFTKGKIINNRDSKEYEFVKYSEYVQKLINSGGLIEHYKKNKDTKGV